MSAGGALNIVTSTFIGGMVEGVLWGINTVLVGLAMFVFFWNRNGTPRNPWLVAVTFVLFTLSTAHFWLEFANLYKGLFFNYFPDSESPEGRAADFIWSLTDFLGQLVLVYRLFVVWNRNWLIIVVPTLMSFVSFGSSMAGLIIAATAPLADATTIAPAALIPLGDLAFCLPLAFQISVTCLIVGRVIVINRRVQATRSAFSLGSNKTANAMLVLIESGFLVLVIQILFVVYFTEQSVVQTIVYGMAAQIYAIAPTLIIVRVGLASAFLNDSMFSTTSHNIMSSFSKSYVSRVQSNQSQRPQKEDVELGLPPIDQEKIYDIRLSRS